MLILILNIFLSVLFHTTPFTETIHFDDFKPEDLNKIMATSENYNTFDCSAEYTKTIQIVSFETGALPVEFIEPTIVKSILEVNQIFKESSNDKENYVIPHYEMNPDCTLNIQHYIYRPRSDLGVSIDADEVFKLYGTYFKNPNHKYLVLVDRKFISMYCGLAQMKYDDSKGENNLNNTSGLAAVACTYNSFAIAHELMHILGGVQVTAPHSTGYGHCLDGQDIMCYQDNTDEGKVMKFDVCPDGEYLFDCNNDDYFSVLPPKEDNYLFNHWNTADSMYVNKVPFPKLNYYYFPFVPQYKEN